jgi:hypothetical protein
LVTPQCDRGADITAVQVARELGLIVFAETKELPGGICVRASDRHAALRTFAESLGILKGDNAVEVNAATNWP